MANLAENQIPDNLGLGGAFLMCFQENDKRGIIRRGSSDVFQNFAPLESQERKKNSTE